jgi:hypothetical protein
LENGALGEDEGVDAFVLFVATERAVGAAVAPMPREGAVHAQVLLVDAPVIVSGSVEDATGGEIAGAIVRPCAQALALTDSDGRFSTRCPLGSAVVQASATHYAALAFATHYGTTNSTFKLRMEPEGVVFGRIATGEGIPPEAVIGLNVELHRADFRTHVDAAADSAIFEARRRRTGRDGEFSFDRLPSGLYRVETSDIRYIAVADREIRAAQGSTTGPLVVTLERACRTDVNVTVGGERCEGGRVTPGYPAVFGTDPSAWTLGYEINEGTATISWGPRSTALSVECTDPPLAGVVTRRHELRRGTDCTASWEIDMPGRSRVDVCVEEDGTPVGGAEFTLGWSDSPPGIVLHDGSTFVAGVVEPTLTGDDGCTRVMLTRGKWLFRSPGARVQTLDIMSEDQHGRIVLRRESAAIVSFEVRQAGKAVVGATLELSDVVAGLNFSSAGTDDLGRVETSAPPGEYDLRVVADGRKFRPDPARLALQAGEQKIQPVKLEAADEGSATVCVVSNGKPWSGAEVVVMELRENYRFNPRFADTRGILSLAVDAAGCAEVPRIAGSVVFARDAAHDVSTSEVRLDGPGPFRLEMPRRRSVGLLFDNAAPESLVLTVVSVEGSRRVRVPIGATRFLIDVPLRGDVRINGCSSETHCVDERFSDTIDTQGEVRLSWKPAPIIRGFVPVREDPWKTIRWNHVGFFAQSEIAEDGSFSIQVPPRSPGASIVSAAGKQAFVKFPTDTRPGEVRDIGLARIPGSDRLEEMMPAQPP